MGAAVWLASGVVWADGADPVAARAQLRQGYALKQQGKCKEAHALLAPVYGWFTEGFDTADLQEAKALLDKLEG